MFTHVRSQFQCEEPRDHLIEETKHLASRKRYYTDKQFDTCTDTEMTCKPKQTRHNKELEPYACGTERKTELGSELIKIITTAFEIFITVQKKGFVGCEIIMLEILFHLIYF